MKKQSTLLAIALSVSMLLSACGTVVDRTNFDDSISAQTSVTLTDIAAMGEYFSDPSPGSARDSVSVVELYNDFKADTELAIGKYGNRDIVSTGVVVRTGPDIHGTPSIELSGTDGGKAYVLYVVNSFDQLDEVSVGETVTMTGNFHIFGSDDWVVLKQGEVIEKEFITL